MQPKELLEQYKDKIPTVEYDCIAHAIRTTHISWLSVTQQAECYTWFAIGKDLREISAIVEIPYPIIALTALKYDWVAKRETGRHGKEFVEQISIENVNNTLALTKLAIDQEIREVMSGKKDARNSLYVPKNSSQLKEFLTLVAQINNVQNMLSAPPKAPQVVVQNNTQVNNDKIASSENQQITTSNKPQLGKPMKPEDHLKLLEAVDAETE